MKSTQELATRIHAASALMEAKRKRFREVETRKYKDWKQRLAAQAPGCEEQYEARPRASEWPYGLAERNWRSDN